METEELLAIIANGEDSRHQFKATINNENSLASEMAAFCNSKGGYILVGVNDDGSISGLTDENIGLSFEGDADDAWSANGTSIIGAATSTGGTCSDTQHSSTLTITNKKSTTATLSFD